MLSLNFIREHPDLVKEGARKKGEPAPVDEILQLDQQRRELVTRVEQLKAEQNRRSAAMAKNRDEAAVEALRRMRDEIKSLEQQAAPIESRLNALLLEVPKKPGRARFDVVTPQAIAAVRGTKWAVDAEGAKTSVFVVDGRVSVARPAGRGSVVLGAGDGVDVEPSGDLIVKRWPPARVTALMARLGQ